MLSPKLWVKVTTSEIKAGSHDYELDSVERIDSLDPSAVEEKLKYVADALKLIKSELAGEKALLGFAGSPWTLATYMVEGGSSKDFKKIKSLFYSDPRAFDQLMAKLTKALIDYLRMQKASGADAVQILFMGRNPLW